RRAGPQRRAAPKAWVRAGRASAGGGVQVRTVAGCGVFAEDAVDRNPTIDECGSGELVVRGWLHRALSGLMIARETAPQEGHLEFAKRRRRHPPHRPLS